MPKNKKKKAQDLLARLVSAAEKDVLAGLILALARKEPEVHRKMANIRRPAFQEEMASGVMGWKGLG